MVSNNAFIRKPFLINPYCHCLSTHSSCIHPHVPSLPTPPAPLHLSVIIHSFSASFQVSSQATFNYRWRVGGGFLYSPIFKWTRDGSLIRFVMWIKGGSFSQAKANMQMRLECWHGNRCLSSLWTSNRTKSSMRSYYFTIEGDFLCSVLLSLVMATRCNSLL